MSLQLGAIDSKQEIFNDIKNSKILNLIFRLATFISSDFTFSSFGNGKNNGIIQFKINEIPFSLAFEISVNSILLLITLACSVTSDFQNVRQGNSLNCIIYYYCYDCYYSLGENH